MKNIIDLYNPYGLIQKAGKNKTHKKSRRLSVQTRSKSRNIQSRKKIYRSRVAHSACRGQTSNVCIEKYGCKKTRSGRRKSYCRKNKNRHI